MFSVSHRSKYGMMFKLPVCTIPGSILTAGLGAKSLDLFRDKTWLASRDFIFILACFKLFIYYKKIESKARYWGRNR